MKSVSKYKDLPKHCYFWHFQLPAKQLSSERRLLANACTRSRQPALIFVASFKFATYIGEKP